MNRLKNLPTSYLIFSYLNVPPEMKKSRLFIDKELEDNTMLYLSEYYTPVFLNSKIELKDLKIINDTIYYTKKSRIESYETDPLYQLDKENNFYLLQKYRIYPDFFKFTEQKQKKTRNKKSSIFTKIHTIEVNNNNIDKLPKGFFDLNYDGIINKNEQTKKIIELMLNEIDSDNYRILKKIQKINTKFKKELLLQELKLEKEIEDYEKTKIDINSYGDIDDLKKNIKTSCLQHTKHIQEREMIFVKTHPSENIQRNKVDDDLYNTMIENSYNELLKRATHSITNEIAIAKNSKIEHIKAESYYSEPVPISYNIPIVKKKFISSYGGTHRCSVVLAIKVKYQYKENSEIQSCDFGPFDDVNRSSDFMPFQKKESCVAVEKFKINEKSFQSPHTEILLKLLKEFQKQKKTYMKTKDKINKEIEILKDQIKPLKKIEDIESTQKDLYYKKIFAPGILNYIFLPLSYLIYFNSDIEIRNPKHIEYLKRIGDTVYTTNPFFINNESSNSEQLEDFSKNHNFIFGLLKYKLIKENQISNKEYQNILISHNASIILENKIINDRINKLKIKHEQKDTKKRLSTYIEQICQNLNKIGESCDDSVKYSNFDYYEDYFQNIINLK